MIKYPKIKILGDEENKGILDSDVEITEKVDSTNMRILLSESIVYGSRNRELEPGTEKMFDKIIVYISNILKTKTKEIKQIRDEYGSVILFGEGIVRHTIGYDFERMPLFLGFDIYVMQDQKFLKSEIRRNLFTKLGLENIHQIFVGKANKIEIPQSVYYNGLSEGVVIKSEDTNLRAKLVDEKFKEKNKEVFGGNKKFAKDDTEYFIARYCTNARIDKIIFKLVDDGHALDMTLMMQLPKLVNTDIWEEEWQDIYPSNLTLDFKGVRRAVSSRCVNVLKLMITQNI